MSPTDWSEELPALPRAEVRGINRVIAQKHEDADAAHENAEELRALLTVATKRGRTGDRHHRDDVLRARERLGAMGLLSRECFMTQWEIVAADAGEELRRKQALESDPLGLGEVGSDDNYA